MVGTEGRDKLSQPILDLVLVELLGTEPETCLVRDPVGRANAAVGRAQDTFAGEGQGLVARQVDDSPVRVLLRPDLQPAMIRKALR